MTKDDAMQLVDVVDKNGGIMRLSPAWPALISLLRWLVDRHD